MSRLLRLYPRAWRERYQAEVTTILEQRKLRLSDRLDLLRGATDAWRRREHWQLHRARKGEGMSFHPWTTMLGLAMVVAATAALFLGLSGNNPTVAVRTAPAISPVSPIDGIQCQVVERLAVHTHQHVALFDHGKQIQLPGSVGIPGTESAAVCLYWLHVHALYPDIVHAESPIARIFTLGNFFDIWKETESDTVPQRANAFLTDLLHTPAGQITVFFNGRRWTRGYRTVPLTPHAVIQIDLGKPVIPFKPYNSWGTL